MKLIYKRSEKYLEVSQSKNIQLAFCNKLDETTFEMVTYWCNCRDFFTDILLLEEIGGKDSIYGFKYDSNKSKIDRDKIRIVIKTHSEEDAENIESNLSILRSIENNNNLKQSTLTKIRKNIYVYEGDAFWLNSCFSLNIYTFLIKIMGYSFSNKENWINEMKSRYPYYTESNYLKKLIPEFNTIINNHLVSIFSSPKTIHGYSLEVGTYRMYLHNNGGVVTLFDKSAQYLKPMLNNDFYKKMIGCIENA
jgi:hypothetical protein